MLQIPMNSIHVALNELPHATVGAASEIKTVSVQMASH